jgi:uncharacterized protein
MKTHAGKPLYSATDLLNFLGCAHATVLDMQLMNGELNRPSAEDDAYLEILKQKGMEHERRYRDKLVAEGRSVVEIERGPGHYYR